VITLLTGDYQILPAVPATQLFGDHMIYGQRLDPFSAVLTGVIVPDHKILTVQQDLFVGNFNMPGESDHTGNGHLKINGMKHSGIFLNHFRFAEKNKDNRSFYITDT
jgi:hypothetical protein